jgi:hypothetical protein
VAVAAGAGHRACAGASAIDVTTAGGTIDVTLTGATRARLVRLGLIAVPIEDAARERQRDGSGAGEARCS